MTPDEQGLIKKGIALFGSIEGLLNAAPKAGQRIRLVQMGNDPDPMQPGATGTVDSTVPDREGTTHLNMRWDPGTNRSLNLVWPIDEVVIIDG